MGTEIKLTSWTGHASITELIQVDRLSLTLTFIPMGNFKAVFSSLEDSEAKAHRGILNMQTPYSIDGAENRPSYSEL